MVPTFVLDSEGHVIIWNRACERLTGVMETDVIGTKEHWRAFYESPRPCLADIIVSRNTKNLDELYPWHAEVDDRGLGLRAENWCVMPRAGKRLYLAIDAGPIYDHEGDLFAVVETLRDITDHKVAQATLESMANRDGLTELANRRAFDVKLKHECTRCERDQTPLALLIGDVDYFKQFNDLYGHPKGDDCLKAVATAFGVQSLRGADLAARYGGEEFAVVLPNTDRDGALRAAERIRNAIWALSIIHAGNPVDGRVTISIGVTSAIPSSDPSSPGAFVATADAALYAAKQGGRNCVREAEVPRDFQGGLP